MFNTPPLLFGAKKALSFLFVLILLSSFTLFIIIILVSYIWCGVYFNAHNFRCKSAHKCSYDPLRVIFSTQWIFKHTVQGVISSLPIHFFLVKFYNLWRGPTFSVNHHYFNLHPSRFCHGTISQSVTKSLLIHELLPESFHLPYVQIMVHSNLFLLSYFQWEMRQTKLHCLPTVVLSLPTLSHRW